MTFTPIVKLALGADMSRGPGAWTYTDITSLVRLPATYTEGNVGNGALSEVAPQATLTFPAKNDDGRWDEENDLGPWAGSIHRGLPVRIDMGTAWSEILADPFGRTLTDSWGSTPQLPGSTSQTGYPWTVGGVAGDFDATGTTGTCTISTAAPADRYAYLGDTYETDAHVHVRFTAPLATGGSLSAGVLLRGQAYDDGYLVRVNLTTANVIQIEILHLSGGGGFTTLLSATSTGLTHAAATPINLIARVEAQTISAKIWQGDPGTEPGSWTATVTEAVALVEDRPGFVGLWMQKRTSNTNSNPVFAIRDFVLSVPPTEASGFITEIDLGWSGGKMNPEAKITCRDATRRLSKGNNPAIGPTGLNPGVGADTWSSQRRATLDPDYESPIAYYPFEDEDESDSVGSGLPEGKAVFVGGGVTLGEAADDLAGVKSLAQLQAGTWFGAAVGLYGGSDLELSMWVNLRFQSWPSLEAGLFSFTTGNLYWRIVFTPGSPRRLKVWCTPSGGAEVLAMTGVDLDAFGLEVGLEVGLQLEQVGSDISYLFTVRDVDTVETVSGTEPGQTIGKLTNLALQGSSDVTGLQFGHWAFWKTYDSGRGQTSAWGWPGEGAATRIKRVLREAGFRAGSAPGGSETPLGAEGSGTPYAIVREAAKADGGVLRTDRRNYGLTYLPRDARYNRESLLTIDLAQGHVHQGMRRSVADSAMTNDHTASRTRGSSYRYVDQTHIDRYGPEPTSGTYNVETDGELQVVAKHAVAMGTQRTLRMSVVSSALHKSATSTLQSAWMRREVGSMLTVTGTTELPEMPYGDVMAELSGWWQQLGKEAWDLRIYTALGRPWYVAAVEGDGTLTQPRFRAQASTSVLAAGITSSATSITVSAEADGILWETGAPVDPTYIKIYTGAGPIEVCELTNVTGASTPQTFTVVRSVNGVAMAHSAGALVKIYNQAGLRR